MDYLTNYYKNLSEDLSRRLTFLEQVAGSTGSDKWTTGRKAEESKTRPVESETWTTGRKAVQTAQAQTPTEDDMAERRRMEAQFEIARQKVAEILAMSTFNKTQTTQWKPPATEERFAAEAERARQSSGLAATERRKEELDKAALKRFREEQARKQQEEQAKAEEAKKKREAYLAWKAEQEKSNK